jgi:hypothetical protein
MTSELLIVPGEVCHQRVSSWLRQSEEDNDEEEKKEGDQEQAMSLKSNFEDRRIVVCDGIVKVQYSYSPSDRSVFRVWIPNSIEVLKFNSFNDCRKLFYISFESNSRLTRIEWNVFWKSSLQSIVIPSTVEILGFECFSSCESLLSISFESNSHLIRIGSRAFSNSSLQSMLIPSSVEILGSSCFSECKSLSSISFESNSHLTRIESETFSNSSLQSILIPSSVEVLGSSCFSSCESLLSISFESNSRLTRIESETFSKSSLPSIMVPRNVEVFGTACFFGCQSLSSISFESNSHLTRIESGAFHGSSLQFILIPRNVDVLDRHCFSGCQFLSSLTFESNSKLTRIESHAFFNSSLQSIVIPRSVQFIDGSAFSEVKLSFLSIEPENEHFVLENDFLIDIIHHKLIRNFSNSSTIQIGSDIEILGSSSFSQCEFISSITFASNSRLTRIESKAFSYSSLQSIVIPRNVEILDSSCFSCGSLSSISFESDSRLARIESEVFAHSSLQSIVIPRNVEILGSSCFSECKSLSSISFESNSRLARIESKAFDGLGVVITIPPTVTFVAFNVIPNPSKIFISDHASCPEFDHWRELRKCHIEVDFRRILRAGCGFGDLSDYQIDLSVFEEISILGDSDNVSSQIYQRWDDGSVFVVKSKHHWKSRKNCEIELENLLNLRHPCIAVPIGFVFPMELSESQELMIVELHAEEHSMAEVLSVNPVWWTATVKAKAVAGIVLGLRFAHSLGLIHGRLDSNNIIFDSDHLIQITNFYPIGLEVGESRKDGNVCAGGFSGKGWSSNPDIRGFGLILFEIVFDHPAKLVDVSNDQMIVHPNVPAFVSKIIATSQSPNLQTTDSFLDIFEILKANNFAIVSGVDSADVLSFVNWVESFE